MFPPIAMLATSVLSEGKLKTLSCASSVTDREVVRKQQAARIRVLRTICFITLFIDLVLHNGLTICLAVSCDHQGVATYSEVRRINLDYPITILSDSDIPLKYLLTGR